LSGKDVALMAKTTLAALYAAGEPGDSADVLVARAQLFLDKGRSEVAEHLFRRALDLAPAFTGPRWA
jgi:Tfp pilus assembly protein PilF